MAEATSALNGTAPIGAAGLVMAEVPHQAKVTVRGRDAGPALVQAVTAALGVAPPLIANTTTRLAARTVLWLGPGEWRVIGPPGDEAALVEAIRLGGAAARGVLAQGCPLDLHPRVFRAGRCAQSLLAKTDILLHQTDAAPTYEIQVRWSQAAYLWAWLATAAGNLA